MLQGADSQLSPEAKRAEEAKTQQQEARERERERRGGGAWNRQLCRPEGAQGFPGFHFLGSLWGGAKVKMLDTEPEVQATRTKERGK